MKARALDHDSRRVSAFYHRTSAAKEILKQGFRDREATYGVIGANRTFAGVWLSDRPLDAADCIDGDTLLKIEIPEELLAECEWIEEGKHYREWLVPAEIVNAFGPPTICEDEEAEYERFEAEETPPFFKQRHRKA